MKVKTINKILNQKFKDWTESIKDESVKKLVESNTIITGGCIASMLLKEPVNDFDVYFTNKETVLAVADYYVKELLAAAVQKHSDGKEIKISVVDCDKNPELAGINSDKGRVKIFIKSAGIASDNGTGVYEYFESKPDEDGENFVDQAVSSIEEQDEQKIDDSSKEKYRPVFASSNAITLSHKIQIVLRFYGDPNTIHQHYDYIHCTNYWLSSTGKLTLKQEALESLLAKELIYVGSKYPICSVIRTRKFIKRGWTINAGQYLKMCFQISKLDLENLDTLEDQLVGVDAAYFGQLISALREQEERDLKENKPTSRGYGYLATIIDRIF